MSPLTPELDVADLEASLGFYVRTLGFKVRYRRPEDRFAYLEREGAELMLEEAAGPGRRFRTAELEHPYGRGMNLQIACSNAARLHARVVAAGAEVVIPLETRWYRADAVEKGARQFVVADPDGYLLRFYQDLGERPA
ncbi:VOC family protein [uncultured Phenylobacterium sp.]|uniref:bleomycin resistance protein n=1 Tax=uncultured Phenylobacterium sp. TaxID=349273 RepID=UPI0025CBD632|nr:VOC family protein [uncultured Phenylobacterium sp.]